MKFLEDIARRLDNPAPFSRRVLRDVCERCVRVLSENMYGSLGKEWKFDVNQAGTEATVYHTRLEGDRATWEIVFHAHNSGSKRYMIYPKNALALSWVDGGTRYFSKGHEVGGIKAKHFAEKCDRIVADYENTLQRKWERWCETGKL